MAAGVASGALPSTLNAFSPEYACRLGSSGATTEAGVAVGVTVGGAIGGGAAVTAAAAAAGRGATEVERGARVCSVGACEAERRARISRDGGWLLEGLMMINQEIKEVIFFKRNPIHARRLRYNYSSTTTTVLHNDDVIPALTRWA